MRDTSGLEYTCAFQSHGCPPGLIKQPETTAEQDRDHMQLYLVKQARSDELLRGLGAARYAHQLVAGSVFRWIRHPMYASQWLWILAQPLLLQNWVAGPVGSLLFLPLYILRVPREERMLLQQFGDVYRAYMAQTGGVVPRLRR